MVIVRLMGGLGNQMFQYAAARRLAHVNNVPLKLDTSWFERIPEGDTVRKYALHVFNIDANYVSQDEVSKLRKIRRNAFYMLFARLFHTSIPFLGCTYIRERHFHFDRDILKLSGNNVYLDGFWQSEKYFADVQNVIRKEFTININPGEHNARLARIIRNTQSVSIHVRRGDYVSNAVTSRYHGTCSLSYYRIAIKVLSSKIRSPHFFVFSDDHSWAKEYFEMEHETTFIDWNAADEAHEDLRLMSLCKHHIIANSSLSWWGAWLSQNPSKVVVAPAEWFRGQAANTKDLIPEKWIKI